MGYTKLPIGALFAALGSSKEGLSSAEACQRLGPQALDGGDLSLLSRSLFYFWGPIPWAIELVFLSLVLLHAWLGAICVFVLLLLNGFFGFWGESRALLASRAAKRALPEICRVKRDGAWVEIDPSCVVVGDIISLALGQQVYADIRLIEGEGLLVDQSTLPGTSLPVSKQIDDVVYAGSVVKLGEMVGLVFAIGDETFLGKTLQFANSIGVSSRFQKTILQIGSFLLGVSLVLVFTLALIEQFMGALDPVYLCLVLIASIPIAMPAVLSLTMALGALRLARVGVFVSHFQAVEDLAGVDIVCCDKTGTLTENQMRLSSVAPAVGVGEDALLLFAYLSSDAKGKNPFDKAVLNRCKLLDVSGLEQISLLHSNPHTRRSEAEVKDLNGRSLFITKGAPHVVAQLCQIEKELEIQSFGEKGYRTLAVARSDDGKKTWQFLGFINFSDPLREDSLQMVESVQKLGAQVMILSGDHGEIVKEISSRLGVGAMAQMLPEMKFEFVFALQKRGHIVAMTGDGVNDLAALKQANVAIAVDRAGPAVRSAGSLVMTTASLFPIIDAIVEARRILHRVKTYCIYRVSETIRILLFIVLSIMVYGFTPISASMLMWIALLNDLPILAISTDHTAQEPHPIRLQKKEMLILSILLGPIGLISSFSLLAILRNYFALTDSQLQSILFLNLVLGGHLTLLIARTKGPMLSKPYPSPILLSCILATQIGAIVLVRSGLFGEPLSVVVVGALAFYAVGWCFLTDFIKHKFSHSW